MRDIGDEIADKADEIAMELYNKEWSKLPHDQQDDVMQLASDEVMGVGIDNAGAIPPVYRGKHRSTF